MKFITWKKEEISKPNLRERLQEALNGGNVELRLPEGCYLLDKGLFLYDHTRIYADPNALIRVMDGVQKKWNDHLVSNADQTNGNCDIEIHGGIWDANGAGNPRGPDHDFDSHGGVGLSFIRVKKLIIQDTILANASTFFVRIAGVEDFRFEHIRFFNHLPRINQDGIHINGFCKNGVIRDLEGLSPVTPGDDFVALNADDGTDEYTGDNFTPRPMMHGMFKGPIENIEVDHLRSNSSYGFIRILSQDEPVRNIRIHDLRGGVKCDFFNLDHWDFPFGKGNVQGIRISDVECWKIPESQDSPDAAAWAPCFMISLQVHDFEIRNFRRIKLDHQQIPSLVFEAPEEREIEYEPASDSAPAAEFHGKVSKFVVEDGGIDRLYIK